MDFLISNFKTNVCFLSMTVKRGIAKNHIHYQRIIREVCEEALYCPAY